jgi:outer membrane lipoprotein-sorting protein
MGIRQAVLAFVALTLIVGLRGSGAETGSGMPALLAGLEAAFASIRRVETDFRQVKHLALFRDEVVLCGRMTLQPPDGFRWEVTTPVRTTVTADADGITVWDELSGEQRIGFAENPAASMMWGRMADWFHGRWGLLAEQYEVERLADEPLRLRFTPKNEVWRKAMAWVTVEFYPDRRYLRRLELREAGGDGSEIEFFNTRINGESMAVGDGEPADQVFEHRLLGLGDVLRQLAGGRDMAVGIDDVESAGMGGRHLLGDATEFDEDPGLGGILHRGLAGDGVVVHPGETFRLQLVGHGRAQPDLFVVELFAQDDADAVRVGHGIFREEGGLRVFAVAQLEGDDGGADLAHVVHALDLEGLLLGPEIGSGGDAGDDGGHHQQLGQGEVPHHPLLQVTVPMHGLPPG